VNFNLTMIGQMISFAVFIYLTMRFVWPPIVAAMDEREKTIADGLGAADRAQKDLELAQDEVGKKLREAKGEAAEIIELAKKRGEQMVDEAKGQAREEGDRILTAAKAEIEQEANRAKEELRGQVAHLSVVGAEKILQATVDQGAHSDMLDKLAAEL
jgi:F-type H+-transporting ATPase subunit b